MQWNYQPVITTETHSETVIPIQLLDQVQSLVRWECVCKCVHGYLSANAYLQPGHGSWYEFVKTDRSPQFPGCVVACNRTGMVAWSCWCSHELIVQGIRYINTSVEQTSSMIILKKKHLAVLSCFLIPSINFFRDHTYLTANSVVCLP